MMSKTFPWVFSLLWLVILMVMIWAGFWQLRRAEEKRIIQSKVAAGQIHTPVTVAEWLALDAFDQIQVKGQFFDTHFLLDNQIMDGQVGYFVFTSFKLSSGIWVLINRGWTQTAPADFDVLAESAGTELMLTALIADWPKPGIQLGEQVVTEQAVQHVTYLTQKPVIELLKLRHCEQSRHDDCIILPRVLKLDPAMDHGFKRQWQLPRMTVAKHQGYAVQWFTMSLVLCLIYIIFLKKTYMAK